jgi:hypothetical protein
MKRSELKNEIGTYRLTPDNWGDNCIMIDEDAVCQAYADAADVEVSEYDPDGDENNRPDSVVVWSDSNGNFYAVLVPFTTRNGVTHNDGLYMKCQNPDEAIDGGACLYETKWGSFDDECEEL